MDREELRSGEAELSALADEAMDAVTGGEIDTGPGVYRCIRCQWQAPYRERALPRVPPCEKCGGVMMWHRE